VLGRLALGAVIVHVRGLCFYVDYDPSVAFYGLDYVASCAALWLLLWPGLWSFYGLNYAFAYERARYK
jgi:hypothetical protein